MLSITLCVLARIFSNSYLNVFQKILTNKGQKSSVVNFYTYLGLSIIGLFFLPFTFSDAILFNTLIMGCLGALGNYFIIKALSIGELSSVAPINSYKPVVAMLIAFLYLGEIPTLKSIFAILLIILGTYFVIGGISGLKNKAILYRILALVFSGTEAVFIKKIILMTDVTTAFFLWAFFGFIFALIFLMLSKHKPKIVDYKSQLLLILMVGIMQYSTNYVFSKMNVSYVLALFQLSTLLSVFLGVNIFKEKDFTRKIIGAFIMLVGAVMIILS